MSYFEFEMLETIKKMVLVVSQKDSRFEESSIRPPAHMFFLIYF